jgi:hypothetical protein
MNCVYKLSQLIFKVFNDQIPHKEQINLNFEKQLTSRQSNYMINRNNNLNIGMNAPSNRFVYFNGQIPLMWLNWDYLKLKLTYINSYHFS